MTTYNTGNSVGSADPRDLYDNAQVIDDYANSAGDTTSDRLGVSRRTLAGMENEFDADQAERIQRFDTFIRASGYEFLGDYAAGIEVTEYNQIIRDTAGEFWRASGTTELPYTTDGTGMPEGGAFRPVGDAALRQELDGTLASGQGALNVRGSVIYVDTIADLQALPVGELVDGQQVQVKEYHAGTYAGGGGFYWSATREKSDHNGGTVIDPNKSFPDWSIEAEVEGWFTPTSSGTGCYVLLQDKIIFAEQFGAVADNNGNTGNGFDSFYPFFYAINYSDAKEIELVDGFYRSSREINIKRPVKLTGSNAGTSGTPATRIYFDSDVAGIIVNRGNTFSNRLAEDGDPTGSADGAIIDGVSLYGAGTDNTKNGMWFRARAVYKNYYVTGFPGNGVQILASSQASTPDSETGNANNWYMDNGRSYNNGRNGILVQGNDVNAGTGLNIDGSFNGEWGLSDESFLGCTWIGSHTGGNELGPHRATNANARSMFIGPYTESGQGPAFLSRPSIAIGGHHRTGTDGQGARWHSVKLESVEFLEAGSNVTGSVTISNDASAGRTLVLNNRASYSKIRKTHVTFKNDGVFLGSLWGSVSNTSGAGRHRLGLDIYDEGAAAFSSELIFEGHSRNFYPVVDEAWNLGTADRRWGEIFSSNNTINTSDGREKQQIRDLSEAEKRVASALKSKIRAFKWNASVEEKGDKARVHFGVIAQEVGDAFRAEDLDPHDYGVFCYDQWGTYDEDGELVDVEGDRYGLRYDQLLAFIISAI